MNRISISTHNQPIVPSSVYESAAYGYLRPHITRVEFCSQKGVTVASVEIQTALAYIESFGGQELFLEAIIAKVEGLIFDNTVYGATGTSYIYSVHHAGILFNVTNVSNRKVALYLSEFTEEAIRELIEGQGAILGANVQGGAQ